MHNISCVKTTPASLSKPCYKSLRGASEFASGSLVLAIPHPARNSCHGFGFMPCSGQKWSQVYLYETTHSHMR